MEALTMNALAGIVRSAQKNTYKSDRKYKL